MSSNKHISNIKNTSLDEFINANSTGEPSNFNRNFWTSYENTQGIASKIHTKGGLFFGTIGSFEHTLRYLLRQEPELAIYTDINFAEVEKVQLYEAVFKQSPTLETFIENMSAGFHNYKEISDKLNIIKEEKDTSEKLIKSYELEKDTKINKVGRKSKEWIKTISSHSEKLELSPREKELYEGFVRASYDIINKNCFIPEVYGEKSFLTDEESYQTVRNMFMDGTIKAYQSDITGEGINKLKEILGDNSVALVYLSNIVNQDSNMKMVINPEQEEKLLGELNILPQTDNAQVIFGMETEIIPLNKLHNYFK